VNAYQTNIYKGGCYIYVWSDEALPSIKILCL